MSVKAQHPDYVNMLPKWTRCRDAAAGTDAIHNGNQTYLPQLADQNNIDYTNYRDRTTFYNATWRTVSGLQGMLFRKPPVTTVPDDITPMLDDITMSGTPLQIFALEVAEEALTIGRVGVFVDYPIAPGGLTRADALAQNLRPLFKMYKAEAIINWKTKQYKNKTVLGMVVLVEENPRPVDEFEDKCVTQYRVLDLPQTTMPNGTIECIFRVRLFEVQIQGGIEVDVLIDQFYPVINGVNPDEIPFSFIGPDDVSPAVDDPPLIDLVDMNISHYRVSADYEHGCHFTGLPTPVISGYQPKAEGEKFYIGSMTAWVFPNPNAKAVYLEFKGEGLTSLENNMKNKEVQMAILGARMLEVQGKGVESADTAAIHRTGEQSMLASIAQTISIGIGKALKTFCAYAGSPDAEVKFEINKDFFPMPMDALTLTALIAGWQNGAYSFETLFDNLKQGDIIPLENTSEEEQAAIKANPSPAQVAQALTQQLQKMQMEATQQASGKEPTTLGNQPTVKATGGTGANPTITQLQNK